MAAIERVDLSRTLIDIHRNLTVSTRAARPGPPERIDGLTVGLFTMDQPPPHDGERHPDGDEILIVLAGTLRICCDSEQHPVPVRAGEACIVRSGEWHKLEADEPCTVIHITPGPDGEARFRSA